MATEKDPGAYVNEDRTILLTIHPDGSATVAYRESRLDTWSPPQPASDDDINAAPFPA